MAETHNRPSPPRTKPPSKTNRTVRSIRCASPATRSTLGKAASSIGTARDWRRCFPWLLLAILAPALWQGWGAMVQRTPDSVVYLNFLPWSRAAYPLFLDAVAAVFGTVEAVGRIQLVAYVLALAFFGFSMRRAFDAPLPTLILVAFLGHTPHLVPRHAQILTESLTLSCICVLIGALALLLRRPTWRLAAMASLACGLATTFRPGGLPLLLLLPIALWLVWRRCEGRRWAIGAALALPATLCMWGESAAWRAHHGDTSRAGQLHRHLFAKALMIPDAPALDAGSDLVLAHGRAVMAPGRELVDNAPSLKARIFLLRQFELAAQVSTYERALAPVAQSIADAQGRESADLIGKAGREALMARPAAWLRNGLAHYWGMWDPYGVLGPAQLASYRDYVEDQPDSQLFAEAKVRRLLMWQSGSDRTAQAGLVRVAVDMLGLPLGWAKQVFRWLMLASFAASFAAIVLALAQRLGRGDADCAVALAALCGLGAHCHHALGGLVGIAAPRYAALMLPLVAVCGLLMAVWMARRVRSKLRSLCRHT